MYRPFQAVEQAAHELRQQLLASVAPTSSRAQEQELREAAASVSERLQEVHNQLATLVRRLEADRDRIIEAATRRCQENVDSLRELAKQKTRALQQQYEGLMSEAEAVAEGRGGVDNIRETVKSLDESQPVEVLQTCLRLSRQTSQESFKEPVEKANLCVALPPKDQLLEEIQGRGRVCSLDVDPSQCTLKGPASVFYVGEDLCVPFVLETRGQDGEMLEVPDELVVAGARVKTAKKGINQPASIVLPVPSELKRSGSGLIELPLKVSQDMMGREVEVDATVGGQAVKDSPKRVLIFKDPLASAILVTPQHIRSLRALLDFLPGKAFRLLYRASRDGWGANDFHLRCDNQGATLCLFKTHDDSASIFGGFTSQPWESPTFGRYKTDPSAFLFRLSNTKNDAPVRLISSKNHHQAVYCRASYGPTFGANYDLYIGDHPNAAGASNYSMLGSCFMAPQEVDSRTYLAGSKTFVLEEMEVYRVLMKGRS